jgi:CelD/BcsL family acetyltransferase involved in cellulose biosynthesis
MQLDRLVPMPGPRQDLRIEELTSLDRLEAVGPAWDVLWGRAPGATPFASPGWLLPWCRHLLASVPWAIACWRGRTLAALAPTFVYRAGARRVLGMLGGGVSDYQDVLADGPAALETVLAYLAERSDRFDVADLEALPPWSPLIAARAPQAFAAELRDDAVCPVLPLPSRLDELAARISPRFLARVRRQRRRLATRRGSADLALANAATLDEILADLFRLHAARWRARGASGVLADERLRRFHAEAARALLTRGWLRTYALRAGGATLGVLHGFAAQGRTYAYLHGIAPDAAEHSPGSLLLAHAIEAAIADGDREFDLLRGREPYKYRWGAQDRTTRRLVLWRREEPSHGR